jgi:hypothetical protein
MKAAINHQVEYIRYDYDGMYITGAYSGDVQQLA